MRNYNNAFYDLKQALTAIYDPQEAAAIAHEVMEYVTGLNKLERLSNKGSSFTEKQQAIYQQAMDQLITGMPLQYVTGVQWFHGRPFQVNEHVLIPRPETEELVEWIVKDQEGKGSASILDIGTGSGCIPISLKLALPKARVTSCDISKEALEVARINARALEGNVDFLQLDFLNADSRSRLGKYDIIVSNPPYIPISEKAQMDRNVKDYEPGTALFVPDDDPQLFYRAIALFGKTQLADGGAIYCELHRDYAADTVALFEEIGYNEVVLRKDLHGNNRMLRAMF